MDADHDQARAERLAARLRPLARRSDQNIHKTLHGLVDAGASRVGLRSDESVIRGCHLVVPLARMIDHTALKPQTTTADVRALCQEAKRYCFAAVCIPPWNVLDAARWLEGSDVAVCTVVGFPLGANHSHVKATETTLAVRDGATEIDMVIGIGRLKSGMYHLVEEDIGTVVAAARESADEPMLVKVILETALLTDEEKVIACKLAQSAGADFVKTSTGFSSGGATEADVVLMRKTIGDSMGVKASGGIRTPEDAERMVRSGATRIGASASVAIIEG